MKQNLFTILNIKVIMAAIVLCTLPALTGCVKTGGGNQNPITSIPDISNFSLQSALSFVAGLPATYHVSSSSLGDGTFTVNFGLSGGNTALGLTASLTMSGVTGSFTTPILNNEGPTTLTINSISNSAGGNATFTSHNTSSLFDSTGLMVATYTPHGGTATPFNATDVKASLAGTLLNIEGIVWQPDLTTINLYNDHYSGATGTIFFNSNDLNNDAYSTFNGSAHYGVSGSVTIADISAHGSITINTVSPLLTGSFTYTNPDSSVVSGTFSCKAP